MSEKQNGMTFEQACKRLNISEYCNRIFSSNSHGELFHIFAYVRLAATIKDDEVPMFKEWFLLCVDYAEKNWERPESVFQHIFQMYEESHKGQNG